MKRHSLVLVSLAACTTQAPTAQISGRVSDTRSQRIAIAAPEVTALWVQESADPDTVTTDTVPISGTFPAQFQLEVTQPPAMLNDWGVPVGVAMIAAANGAIGIDSDHLLVYLPQDVPAGSAAATILRGTPEAGFHLYGVHHLTDAERATREQCADGLSMQQVYAQCGGSPVFDDFVVLPADLETELSIELVDDASEIEPPNWW